MKGIKGARTAAAGHVPSPKAPKSGLTVLSGAKPPATGRTYSLPQPPPTIGLKTSPTVGTQLGPEPDFKRLTAPLVGPVTARNPTILPTPSTPPASAASALLAKEAANIQSGNIAKAVAGSTAYTAPPPQTSPTPPPAVHNEQAATTQNGSQASAISALRQSSSSSLDAAQKRLLALYAPSAEEQALQDELASFQESAKLGIAGIEGQGRGIPLGLVRGQQAQLEEQAGIKEQTIIQRLATAQAKRQADQQIAQQQYQAAQQEQARQDQLTAPQQVGNQMIRLNPATGQYETVYSAPTSAPEQTANIQEYEYARQNGYTGSFTDYQAAQGGSSGSSGGTASGDFNDLLSVSEAEALGVPYGTTKGQAYGISSEKPLSAEMLKLQENARSGLDSLSTIRGTIGDGTRSVIANQGYKAAEANLVDVIGRLRSGGAITIDEETRFKSLLPGIRDSGPVAAEKLDTLENLLNGVLQQGGSQQTSQTPQGWAPEDWQHYIQGGGDPSVFPKDVSSSLNSSSWSSLGSLSEKYESGGNPGAIGYDSTGGYSYGTYQLAHNNAKNFIEQSPYKLTFKGLAFNSPQWRQTWQNLAKQNPQQFGQAQKAYIAKTHFEPQVAKLAKAGVDVNRLPQVVKDAIWSTAVQHGANTDVVTKALSRLAKNASPAEMLKAIYNERWSGGARFASSTANVKKSVFNRFFGPQGELAMALKRVQSNLG